MCARNQRYYHKKANAIVFSVFVVVSQSAVEMKNIYNLCVMAAALETNVLHVHLH